MTVVESLPRPGEDRVSHAPSADREFHGINPAYICMDAHERFGLRGMNFSAWFFGGVVYLVGFSPAMMEVMTTDRFKNASLLEQIGEYSVVFGVAFFCFLLPYFSARAKLMPPNIICRRTRRIYAWLPSGKRWIEMEYDRIVALIFRQRIVNAGGSMTVYRLQLQQRLRPDSPQFDYASTLGSPFTSPERCGQLWEFIRCYMDGPPEAMPPTELLPPLGTAWMMNADLEMSYVDENHRVRHGIWGYPVFLLLGSLQYWMECSAAWIARTAPRHPFSAQMKVAMQWNGSNPYRIKRPSGDRLLALQGRLLRMRLRWCACGLISTSLQIYFLFFIGTHAWSS